MQARVRGHIVRSFGWFVFFVIVWVILVDSGEKAEHVLGVIVSALAAAFVELAVARDEVDAPLWNYRRLLRYLRLVVPGVFQGTAVVFTGLFRHLTGRKRLDGSFFAVHVELPDTGEGMAGKEALATVAITTVPNTVVVGFDESRQLVLIHELVATGERVETLRRWLQ